ncbi:DNA polymerase II [Pseudoalteromonas sp. MMG012]|uniref:DNA polymerase II n=1 Tax=Pseudoalteromonas sp. MMG012 TaxID=2822686 RepID=UPI001B3A5108|nr:DNA polymerase II [Pseudoalteromonas sp. MMG012]MBQ4848967.1 DNA polymerase II [Pseudoalteromonas sp. MMG012]
MTQAVYPGFILSRQQVNHKGQLNLCFWLKTEQGVFRAIVEAQTPVFFIRQSEVEKVTHILQTRKIHTDIRDVKLKHFDGEVVCACYFTTAKSLFDAKRVLKGQCALYEDDIRHHDRYLMERFIKGGVWVTGNYVQKLGYVQINDARLKAHPDYTPQLSVLSLDIECSGEGILFSVGLASNETQCVIMVGAPQEGDEYIIWVADETELLYTLMSKIKELDPDVFIGWNVIEFDFVVLAERALALGIDLILGRDDEAIYVYRGNYVRILISGRVVIDGIDTLKNATYHFESFSLANVSKHVLGKSKLLEQDNRLEEIIRQFNEDKLSLAAYNLQDCQLVLAIFSKLKLLDFAIARTRLTGLELERMGGSVAAFTNLYLPLLHRSGYIAPNLGEHGLSFDSPGGYVMESSPGLYRNVIVLDYKSLYPSIIRTFFIDPLALITGLRAPADAISGFNGGVFSRVHHHLPELVARLLHARQEAKLASDPMLSQAIKIIMNSLYGVLGSTGCRFYDPRLSSSITLRGHEIMMQTKAWIEAEGYEVIYGDTDSTFVCLPESWDVKKCNDTGLILMNLINERWREYCDVTLQLQSYLEIEFETHYSPFFLPTIRGDKKGSKKRYVGQVLDKDHHKLVFKGMESVRSDWTKIARNYQEELFEALFSEQDLFEITDQYINNIRQGKVDHLLLYSKRLGREVEMYTKNVPPHVKAARNHMMKNPSIKYRKGQVVAYTITFDGPRVDAVRSEIDYEHYIEKQIFPILTMLPNYENVFFKLTGQKGFSF